MAAIGTAETVHAATRGENITVIFVNNAIYGMTGGQMAPTSLPNQVTQTTPYGRDVNVAGYPVRVCEMLSTLDGVALAQRVTVDCVKNVNIAKKRLKRRFRTRLRVRAFPLSRWFPPVPPTGDYLRLRRFSGCVTICCLIIPWAFTRTA